MMVLNELHGCAAKRMDRCVVNRQNGILEAIVFFQSPNIQTYLLRLVKTDSSCVGFEVIVIAKPLRDTFRLFYGGFLTGEHIGAQPGRDHLLGQFL